MPPKDKPAPVGSTLDPFETGVWYFFIIILLGSIITRFLGSGTSGLGAGATGLWATFKIFFLAHIFPILYVVAIIFSALFAIGIINALRTAAKAQKAMDDFYNPPVLPAGDTALLNEPKNAKWDRVINHLNSQNQNDWKFAIIESDIMLADLLEAMRYEGETVAERLKKVEASDFLTIENAWEAHKMRNAIAHEGADLILSEREARRVIELYRSVFAEFKII